MTTREQIAADAARHRQHKLSSPCALTVRKKFLRFFPKGFRDEKYIAWERGYKWTAHEQWNEALSRSKFRSLLNQGEYAAIAAHAVRIESKTNLLFSFEKMALRDAVKSEEGAHLFANGLDALLYGKGALSRRFETWCDCVANLPRRQTRVLTWPLVTVFGFLAQPSTHIFLKPNVTRAAARAYCYDFQYESRPSWPLYNHLLQFAATVRSDLKDLQPRDNIDIQSFLWVQGSDEYDE